MNDQTENDYINFGISIINNKSNEELNKTVIVLGLGRSGTSMIAGILDKIGVFMGNKKDDIVYEDLEFTYLLEESGSSSAIKAFISRQNTEYSIWGWKRPKAIHYIDRFMHLLRNPYFIIPFRDLLSIATRNVISMNMDPLRALNHGNNELQLLLRFINCTSFPVMMVSYEKAMLNKHLLIERTVSFLNLTVSHEQKESAIKFIQRDRPEYLQATRIKRYNGFLDSITEGRIRGWIKSIKDETPVNFIVLLNGKKICSGIANGFRKDLKISGIGNGCHAFDVNISEFCKKGDYKNREIRVLVQDDTTDLQGSPKYLD